MLNILRKNAQSIVVQAIVVIIAVVFVFWGVGSNLQGNPNAVAEVNGVEISYREFQQSYERAVENYKQQFGGQMPQDFLQRIGLKEQILDQLIQAELLRQGAEKVGIAVSKEATQRKIREMAAFQKEGRFDLTTYKGVLERNRLSPTNFESGIHNDLLINRAVDAIGAFGGISAHDMQMWDEYGNQEIKLEYAAVRSEEYKAQVQVVEDELSGWFATAQQNYKTAPARKLRYLAFSYDDDLSQVAIGEDAVRTYYQEHAKTYALPEKRRARHILFKAGAEDSADTRAAQKVAAEKILGQIRQGEDFAQLASRHSEDASKNKGGDLGFFARGQMVQPFEDTVFALRKGEVSGVVETPFGYHIIRLEEIAPAKIIPIDEVRDVIRQTLERQGVKAITFKKASVAYEAIIRAGSLEKYSGDPGAHPVQQTDLFAQDSPPKAGLVSDPEVLRVAFGLRKGELSSMVETAHGYAILFVDEAREAIVRELSEVRDRAVADFREEKSTALAKAAAEQLLKTAREQQGWPEGLQKETSGYLTRSGATGPVPAELREDAFSRVGREAFPGDVLTVGRDFYLYRIVDTRKGQKEMDATQRRTLEQQLLAVQKNRLMADWLGQQRNEAKIWTNAKLLQ